MDTTSVWRAGAPAAGYAMLQGHANAEVLVIGGGITGVTLAYLLARPPRRTRPRRAGPSRRLDVLVVVEDVVRVILGLHLGESPVSPISVGL